MPLIIKSPPIADVHAEWWAEGDTVTIKTYYSDGDRLDVEEAAAPIAIQEGDRSARIEMRTSAAILAKLRAGVVRWTSKDERGRTLPVTDANLRAMDRRDREFILQAMNEHGWLPVAPADEAEREEAEEDEATFPG